MQIQQHGQTTLTNSLPTNLSKKKSKGFKTTHNQASMK